MGVSPIGKNESVSKLHNSETKINSHSITDNPAEFIKNYADLKLEEKQIAEEMIYKKQLGVKEINRTLEEIIDKQIKEKEKII